MGNTYSSDGERDDVSGGGGSGGGGAGSRPGLSSRGLSHRITGGGSNYNAASHSRQTLLHLSVSLPMPFRSGGNLGLSRAELDARCQPSGLVFFFFTPVFVSVFPSNLIRLTADAILLSLYKQALPLLRMGRQTHQTYGLQRTARGPTQRIRLPPRQGRP
jgi:hypothetical protein